MTIPLAGLLDRALRDANIPISGVSIGRLDDRATWRIHYLQDASDEQRQAGAALMANLDAEDAKTIEAVLTQQARARLADPIFAALVQALYEAMPSPTVTLDAVHARLVTLYAERAKAEQGEERRPPSPVVVARPS